MNKPPALNALFSTSNEQREFGSVETSPILRFIRPTALVVWVLVFCVQAQTLVSTGSGANWMVMLLSTLLFAAVHVQFWYEESEQGRRFTGRWSGCAAGSTRTTTQGCPTAVTLYSNCGGR